MPNIVIPVPARKYVGEIGSVGSTKNPRDFMKIYTGVA